MRKYARRLRCPANTNQVQTGCRLPDLNEPRGSGRAALAVLAPFRGCDSSAQSGSGAEFRLTDSVASLPDLVSVEAHESLRIASDT